MKYATAVLLFLLGAQVHAQEPLTFKGFGVGAAKAEVLAAYPKSNASCDSVCFWSPRDCLAYPYGGQTPETDECRKAISYGGVLPMNVMLTFQEGKLVSAYVVFSSVRFDHLAAAMIERFGKPDSDEMSIIENRMGAKFDTRTVMWSRSGAVLRIKKRSSNIDNGSVLFSSTRYLQEQELKKKESVKAGAKDL